MYVDLSRGMTLMIIAIFIDDKFIVRRIAIYSASSLAMFFSLTILLPTSDGLGDCVKGTRGPGHSLRQPSEGWTIRTQTVQSGVGKISVIPSKPCKCIITLYSRRKAGDVMLQNRNLNRHLKQCTVLMNKFEILSHTPVAIDQEITSQVLLPLCIVEFFSPDRYR